MDYRVGDMLAPKLSHREALDAEAENFISCVKTRSQPMVNGTSGLEVVKLICAAQLSIRNNNMRVSVELGEKVDQMLHTAQASIRDEDLRVSASQ